MAEGGLSDAELLKRLSALYGEAFVAGVAKELADASITEGRAINQTFCVTFCLRPGRRYP